MKLGILVFTACLLLSVAEAGTPLPQTDFFVQNEGQWEGAFAFRYEGDGATYFLTSTGMTIDLRKYDLLSSPRERGERTVSPDDVLLPRARGRLGWGEDREPVTVHGHVLRLTYLNANPTPILTGEEKLASYSNYFLGRDSCKWRSRVGHYRSVLVKEVWPGIDVEYRVTPEGTDAVYHVHPFADASLIQLRYEGQQGPISIEANCRLHLRTSLGDVFEKAPFAYQDIHHQQREIPCHFELVDERIYRLSLGEYDPSQDVVIDPLIYCSYWGGYAISEVMAITQDSSHHKFLAGEAYPGEAHFPITPGAYSATASDDAGWISKFSPGGDTLLYSTFLGGGPRLPVSIAVDAQGAVYVVGSLYGQNCGTLPLTTDAFDTTCADDEGFISRYSADGTALEYSSYLGGGDRDYPVDVKLDSDGSVYVWGVTDSHDFPVTANALYPEHVGSRNGFLSVFDPHTSSLSYSTYFPPDIDAGHMDVEPGQRVWLCGEVWASGLPTTPDAYQTEFRGPSDGFFALLDLQSNSLLYSSYLGGGIGSDPEDRIDYLLPLGGDTVVLCGRTWSHDFPVTPNAFDTLRPDSSLPIPKAFVTMLDLPGNLLHSTLLGPIGGYDTHFAVDEQGSFVAGGQPSGHTFPMTPDAEDSSFHPGFVARLSHDLRHLEHSTYWGGSGDARIDGMLLENRRSFWLVGATNFASDLPTTPNALIHNTPFPDWDSIYGFYLRYAMPQDSPDVTPSPVSMPRSFALSAYPNPFNPSTTLTFTLPHEAMVRLRLYNLQGQEVMASDEGRLSAGEHRVLISGESLASGIYFARVETGGFATTCKIMLLR